MIAKTNITMTPTTLLMPDIANSETSPREFPAMRAPMMGTPANATIAFTRCVRRRPRISTMMRKPTIVSTVTSFTFL